MRKHFLARLIWYSLIELVHVVLSVQFSAQLHLLVVLLGGPIGLICKYLALSYFLMLTLAFPILAVTLLRQHIQIIIY